MLVQIVPAKNKKYIDVGLYRWRCIYVDIYKRPDSWYEMAKCLNW